MKVSTQAFGLEKLMKSQVKTKVYALALPLVKVKQARIESLNIGDVLLLKKKKLKPMLIDEDNNRYKIKLLDDRIKIIKKKKKPFNAVHTKKYKKIKATFFTLELVEVNEQMEIKLENENFDILTLTLDGSEIGKGVLMQKDDRVTMKITRVSK